MFSHVKTLWIISVLVGFFVWPQKAPAMSCQMMFSESRNVVQLYHALKRNWYLDLDQFDHGLAGLHHRRIKDVFQGADRVIDRLMQEEVRREYLGVDVFPTNTSDLTLNQKMVYELLKNRGSLVTSDSNLGEFKRLYRQAYGIDFDPSGD